jgi:transcriptional regulator with XRE-family HTH domain
MDNKLGDYLKERRQNDSLREFAYKLGISHTHLDSIERGYDPRSGKPVKITVDTLSKIAKGLGMSVNELLLVTKIVENNEDERYISKEYSNNKISYLINSSSNKKKITEILEKTAIMSKEDINMVNNIIDNVLKTHYNKE